MASAPSSQAAAAVQAFAAAHYAESGAARFGIDVAGLVTLLADVLAQRGRPVTMPKLRCKRCDWKRWCWLVPVSAGTKVRGRYS